MHLCRHLVQVRSGAGHSAYLGESGFTIPLQIGWHIRQHRDSPSGGYAGHVQMFNAPDSDIRVFILSTRAGGLGLNLQTADTVIMCVMRYILAQEDANAGII